MSKTIILSEEKFKKILKEFDVRSNQRPFEDQHKEEGDDDGTEEHNVSTVGELPTDETNYYPNGRIGIENPGLP